MTIEHPSCENTTMGLTYADVRLENPLSNRSLDVRTLVDSGSVFLTVPSHVAIQLGFDLTQARTREVTLGDGSHALVPLIGPLRVRYLDRDCDLSALVLGDEALFGAVPMEMMDLVLNPASQTLTVNPHSPYVPSAKVK